MFCRNCGKEIDENSVFCGHCGTQLRKERKEENPISPSPTQEEVEAEVGGRDEVVYEKNEKKGKKIWSVLLPVFVILLGGLGLGGYFVKVKTDDFKNFTNTYREKLDAYDSLGKYKDSYAKVVEEAENLQSSYRFWEYSAQTEKMEKLVSDVDALKVKVEGLKKEYHDLKKAAEKENNIFFGDSEEEYNKLKKKIKEGLKNLEDEAVEEKLSEYSDLIQKTLKKNENEAKKLEKLIKKESASNEYFEAEKGFIKQSKEDLAKAVKKKDFVRVVKIFEDFKAQKKVYENTPKSDYFNRFIQMDVSEKKKIKLYYEGNGNQWKQDKFTILEKEKGGKKWTRAEILSMKQVKGDLSIDLVVDISGSMDTIFEEMKNSVRNFISGTDDKTKLGLSIINTVYRRESGFTTDSGSIIDKVNALEIDGLTSLYQSLYSSVIYTASQSGPKSVVAFTDGINEPYGAAENVTVDHVIEVAKKYKVPVYIIALGSNVDTWELKRITGETGGIFYENRSAYDIYSIYQEIYEKQKEVFELVYKSSLKNSKERKVYVNYFDEGKLSSRSEFNIEPDEILSGYKASGLVDASNLESFYTKKKYISTDELYPLSTIGELQTIINIYFAKNGYHFKPDGDALKKMKSMGIIKKNGTLKVGEVTKKMKKNAILWANYNALFNYRFEWIYRIVSRLYYQEGIRDRDELNTRLHEELGEERGRFSNDLDKSIKKIERGD